MKLRPCWLDGEVVVLSEKGFTDFNALQNAFDHRSTQQMLLFLFDVPFYDGYDLRAVPLVERRALPRSILAKPPPPIRFSEAFDAPPRDILASACEIGLEGVIGKRKASGYPARRSPDWIKLKCSKRQEFVIGGYTDRRDRARPSGDCSWGLLQRRRRARLCGQGRHRLQRADVAEPAEAHGGSRNGRAAVQGQD
jgi:bifunctional non-homologous end joining protein LigD